MIYVLDFLNSLYESLEENKPRTERNKLKEKKVIFWSFSYIFFLSRHKNKLLYNINIII